MNLRRPTHELTTAFRRWLMEYPFQLISTLTFPRGVRPPRDENDFGRFHARIGKALKALGRKSRVPVCALGIVVVTHHQLVHAHNLVWVGEGRGDFPLSRMAVLLDRAWPHVSLTEPIRSPADVAAYIAAQQEVHGTRLTDLFSHGPDWLDRIRGA